MTPRVAAAVVMGAGFALGLTLALVGSPAGAQGVPHRTGFQIGTGSTAERYFPLGELLAGLISHPPGAQRCERAKLCGPPGLIASARTSEGAIANVLAVNRGQFNSGIAQSDLVAEAVAGKGAFAKAGPQKELRVLAALFPEQVHLVAAPNAGIKKPEDLRRKRVLLGPEGSGTLVAARAVLSAARLSEKSLKPRYETPEQAAQLLESKQIDAFFYVGGAPVARLHSLLTRRAAVLVPIEGATRTRLLKAQPGLSADTLAPNTYPGSPKLETVRSRTVWIVNASQPAPLIYDVTRALFEPGNVPLFLGSLRRLNIDTAPRNPPAPLHPGAQRFYRDKGKL